MELNLQAKGETSPLKTGKFEPYFVSVYVLLFVNMYNYIAREDSLSTIMVIPRGVFILFIPLKLRFYNNDFITVSITCSSGESPMLIGDT